MPSSQGLAVPGTPSGKAALRAHLAQLDAEIERLQTRLGELAIARKPVADALGSIVYPILSIPPEITAEIFMEYVAADAQPNDDPWSIGLPEHLLTANPHFDKSDGPLLTNLHATEGGPLLLASVCRAWRDIALSLPTLWCRLRMSPASRTISSILQCWLPRAGNLPLDLNLRHYDGVDACTADLFNTLAPYSMQWRTFWCMLRTSASFPLDAIQSRIPLLRKLTLRRYPSTFRDNTPPTTITAFSDAPRLCEVVLYSVLPRSITLPWAQLTRLELHSVYVEECAEILPRIPQLETLSATLYENTVDSPLPRPIRLGNLHTLQLSHPMQQELHLLDFLILPGLKCLDIFVVAAASVAKLASFLARSDCQLRLVSLTCSHPSYMYWPSTGISALEALGVVSEVHLPGVDWPQADFTAFFIRIATDPGFLPNMETLCIEKCKRPLPYAALTEMLTARWRGRSNEFGGLRSFRFIRKPNPNEPDEPPDSILSARLEALVEEGLTIDIR
ncbi:hypothetical protein FB451DRAFT_1367009 [Mycena latifolia]|nr:hypothetical protein FB451DRAFT_1367009 [Mycena latifolia]